MILKFKNSDGNWSFREGEITYRQTPWEYVLKKFVEGFDPKVGSTATREELERMITDRMTDCNIGISERDIALYFIENRFSDFDCATDVVLSTDNIKDFKSVLGVYFVQIWNREDASAEYILLEMGTTEAYLLSDSGKTIEKLN